MSNVSYFKNAKHFVANPTFNTYVSGGDALQYLHQHSATGAMHDSEERYPPPLCHPGTGEAVVGRIEAWYGFEVPPEKKIMWVFAPAGYGKTSVAGTVSKRLESRTDLDFNPVGATFFFWRTSPERNSPARFIITLAYQFAMSIPELAPHIDNAVKRNPMILNKALEAQLMKLIVEPFKSLGELDNMPHRLVIIDGLDECINSDQESRVEKPYAEDQERVQVRVLDLIYTLQSHQLPLCFLILSRPEPWIKHHIKARPFRTVAEMLDLYEVGNHMKDVEKFVRDELARIAESLDTRPGDDEQWPEEELVQNLLWTTRGHMLFAATVIRHIDVPYDDPPQRLQNILTGQVHSNSDLTLSSPFSSLFELYRQIIRSCPPANKATMVEVLEDVLTIDDMPFTPINLTLDTLDSISGRPAGRGIKVLRPLHAVMRLVTHKLPGAELSVFYHSSFPEFLNNHSQLGLDIQKGIGRLLAGALKALPTAISNNHGDDVSLYAVSQWAHLWLVWQPSTEAEYSRQLKALLAIDLTALFVKAIASGDDLLACILYLYHPTGHLLVRGISPTVSSPFIEDAVSHLRSSIHRGFLHTLRPDVFTSRFPDASHSTSEVDGLIVTMASYANETSKDSPTWFASIAQALRTLRREQEELYRLFERNSLTLMENLNIIPPKRQYLALKQLFELARQDGELQDTDIK
jgi:hypothetical protein